MSFQRTLQQEREKEQLEFTYMANNIKKYIEVHYDVTPYFKVSPKNVVIY